MTPPLFGISLFVCLCCDGLLSFFFSLSLGSEDQLEKEASFLSGMISLSFFFLLSIDDGGRSLCLSLRGNYQAHRSAVGACTSSISLQVSGVAYVPWKKLCSASRGRGFTTCVRTRYRLDRKEGKKEEEASRRPG